MIRSISAAKLALHIEKHVVATSKLRAGPHGVHAHRLRCCIFCMAEHELLRREGHSKGATNRMLPVVTCRLLTRESVMACRGRPTILTSPYSPHMSGSQK